MRSAGELQWPSAVQGTLKAFRFSPPRPPVAGAHAHLPALPASGAGAGGGRRMPNKDTTDNSERILISPRSVRRKTVTYNRELAQNIAHFILIPSYPSAFSTASSALLFPCVMFSFLNFATSSNSGTSATTANVQFFPAINLCATAVYFSSGGGMDKTVGGKALVGRDRDNETPLLSKPTKHYDSAHEFEKPRLKRSLE